MIIETKHIESSLCRFFEGDKDVDCYRLHSRSNYRGGLFRLPLDGGTVVVKVWYIRNFKERLKSLARLSNGWREWCMHRMVYQAGIMTPEPIAFFRLSTNKGGYLEAMVMEDIGAATSSLAVLKRIILKGDEAEVISFENQLIDLTARFINLNIIDIDHQLNNLVVDSNGRLMRVDFECARKRLRSLRPNNGLAKMVARFITGHVHAVQPNVDRSVEFARRLYKKININSSIRYVVNENVKMNMSHQYDYNGIDTQVNLPL